MKDFTARFKNLFGTIEAEHAYTGTWPRPPCADSVFSTELVKSARARMKPGEAWGTDGFGAEQLTAIGDNVVEKVALLLSKLAAGSSKPPRPWEQHRPLSSRRKLRPGIAETIARWNARRC